MNILQKKKKKTVFIWNAPEYVIIEKTVQTSENLRKLEKGATK